LDWIGGAVMLLSFISSSSLAIFVESMLLVNFCCCCQSLFITSTSLLLLLVLHLDHPHSTAADADFFNSNNDATNSNSNVTNATIWYLVRTGRLSAARSFALEQVWMFDPSSSSSTHSQNQKLISKSYIDAFSHALADKNEEDDGEGFLNLVLRETISSSSLNHPVNTAKHDDVDENGNDDCISNLSTILRMKSHSTDSGSNTDLNQLWDDTCSILPPSPTEPQQKKKQKKEAMSLMDMDYHHSESSPSSSPQRRCCCEFRPGNWAYLRLPVLFEPAVRVVIPRLSSSKQPSLQSSTPTSMILNLEQEGYLRPFDVSSLLWPTGYLLTVCFGDVWNCPIPELQHLIKNQLDTTRRSDHSQPFALELGTGIGAPSIALARSLQDFVLEQPQQDKHNRTNNPNRTKPKPMRIVATDKAPHSLSVTITNAYHNGISISSIPSDSDEDDIVTLTASHLDYMNLTSVQRLKERFFPTKKRNGEEDGNSDRRNAQNDGFSLIYGSSLQALFQYTNQNDSMLWTVLDMLLLDDDSSPPPIVLLAHTRSSSSEDDDDDSPKTGKMSLQVPPEHENPIYQLVRCIDGSTFGMKTLYDFDDTTAAAADLYGGTSESSSDFEICVFTRRKRTNMKNTTATTSTPSDSGLFLVEDEL
jgi:hypothetical protein